MDNVAQTVRAITELLDNVWIVQGSDSWPAFEMPVALFPDIYKESDLPKANPNCDQGTGLSYSSVERYRVRSN